MKHAALGLLALAACAHSAATQQSRSADLGVQDALHGVRYALPSGADSWQVSREGNARSVSGVEAEVSSFAMAKPSTTQQCREHARSRLSGRKDAPANAVPASLIRIAA